jgi:hypothetical protein
VLAPVSRLSTSQSNLDDTERNQKTLHPLNRFTDLQPRLAIEAGNWSGDRPVPRERKPTAAETLDHLKTINKSIFRDMSPGTKTGLMAAAAFFLTFVMFSPKPTPPNYYTGCELKGAIERCAEFAAEVTKWRNVPLPRVTGEPSRADQIRALQEQDEWLRDTYYEERGRKTQAETDEWIRQNYARRGVKD